MKKLSIIFVLMLLGTTVFAQSRKYVTQFSHLQQYFNPALTGYEGSMVRGFVRNQWAGWEGAPMTYFASVDLDFAELSGVADPALMGKNAVGLNMLHDRYGAFVDTELLASYASRIQITKSMNLRMGVGVNYNFVQLDGNNLTTEQVNDPLVARYLNSFADMRIVDFNLGMALTHDNFYVSYAVHNVNQGAISSGDVFMERKPRVGIIQAGYRSRLSDNLSVSVNGMYRRQGDLPDNMEIGFKTMFRDKFWIGAGHRVDYANHVQLGFVMNRLRLGYVYEMPMLRSYLLPNTTHEFLLSYSLFGNVGRMW